MHDIIKNDMEFKGTKGKWKVITAGKIAKDWNEITIGTKDADIANLSLGELDYKTQLANARLMANAKQLLEASIAVCEMLSFNKGEEIPDDAWEANGNHLRSVINKALGK